MSNIKVPQYLTIENYYKLADIAEIRNPSDLVNMVKLITDMTDDEIRVIPKKEIEDLISNIMTMFTETQPLFWQVFEFEGKTYGFQPPSKMTLGEWIDIESYANDWKTQLHKMMAVCYREVKDKRWKNPLWKAKYNLKVMTSKQEKNLFDYYDVQPYEGNTFEQEQLFLNLPIEIALGAMAFFLTLKIKHTEVSAISSNPQDKETIEELNQTLIDNLFQPTMAGS